VKNPLGTLKEHIRSKKIHHPTLSPKKKKPSPLVHATLPHWLQEFILPICILCHFWHRLMAGAVIFLMMNFHYFDILKNYKKICS
jgi:hypothetical protein